MYYPECKVYSDGSCFIAIPHTEGKKGKRPKKPEPNISVNEPTPDEERKQVQTQADTTANDSVAVRQITPRQLFDELYKKYYDLSYGKRKAAIAEKMARYFKSETELNDFLDINFKRKLHNYIQRKMRMVKKINNQGIWTHFVTFTYGSKKVTEQQFKKKLANCLKNRAYRYGWKYIGVWERGKDTERLHFHALMYIPYGTMPGEIIEVNDWDSRAQKRRTTHQNTFFIEKFGRNDFEELADNYFAVQQSVKYIIKYIEKTGARIVCSKGLYQYFISDIVGEDILCELDEFDENRDPNKIPKFVLAADFGCWDEGLYMGKVSRETIAKMRKSN